MKIVGFAPRASRNYPIGEPWGLLAAMRLAVKAGHQVEIRQSVKGEPQNWGAMAAQADIVAISVLTGFAITEAIEVSRMIKRVNGSIKVVWGGWHPSIAPEQVLTCEAVDAVVIGQGERTFAELVHAVETGKKLKGIQGLMYRENGGLVKNPPRKFEDINNFPPLPYSILNANPNIRPTAVGKRTIRYCSSQGCPHRCGFCVEPPVYGRHWSGLKAQRVVDELAQLVSLFGIDSVMFTDSNFFVDAARVHEIARLMIERGLNLKWGNANGRTAQLLKLPEATWDLLKQSGCSELLVGAESGLQEGLDLIQKDCTVAETVELTKRSNAHGIPVRFSMMVGLPYENDAGGMAAKELDAIMKMVELICPENRVQNSALVFHYTPYPGTPLYERSLKLGMKAPESLEDWAHFELTLQNTPWVPAKISRRVAMLTEYIWGWLGPDYVITASSTRGWKHIPAVIAAKVFRALCKARWKLKCFWLPLDYYLFRELMRRWKPV